MSDFVRLVIDWIAYLWPLRLVEPWERGLYVVCGRWTFEVKPGVYFCPPWFCAVKTCAICQAIICTPRQDVTLTDGGRLSFTASANVRVTDVTAAFVQIDNYTETTQENIAAVLSEKLSEVDASRITADKRGRLLSDLKRWVNEETKTYGVEVEKLRFTNFVLNAPTFRLLQDGAIAVATW